MSTRIANSTTQLTEQAVQNLSFDQDFQVLAIELLGFDSTNNALVRLKVDSNGVVQTSGGTALGTITNPFPATGFYMYATDGTLELVTIDPAGPTFVITPVSTGTGPYLSLPFTLLQP